MIRHWRMYQSCSKCLYDKIRPWIRTCSFKQSSHRSAKLILNSRSVPSKVISADCTESWPGSCMNFRASLRVSVGLR